MSFAFRGSAARPDMETGFHGFIPDRRTLRVHATAARPVSSNSLAFLVIEVVLLLFMVLNSHQMSPNFLLWLVLGVFLMATMLRMYATCQQLQAQAHAAIASGFLLRLYMPQSIALATRGRVQGLRLQLALLDREFNELDYETLRALDSYNFAAASMSEEEINALPIHQYKATGLQCGGSSLQRAPSGVPTENKKQDAVDAAGKLKASEDELTCTVCLEQVDVGELIRTLPCLHKFHAVWIDPWLRQQGTCPVCKFKAGWHGSEHGGSDVDLATNRILFEIRFVKNSNSNSSYYE